MQIRNLVKHIMDRGSVETDRSGENALERLGFRAALLHPRTLSIYVLGPDKFASFGTGFLTGFERNGFFYTRSAAARAAAEWA